VQVTEAVREWDYGDYEGLTSKEIKKQRAEKGMEPWNIWTDGCPGGEYVFLFHFFLLFPLLVLWVFDMGVFDRLQSGIDGVIWIMLTSTRSPDDIVRRLDAVIADIREKYHRPCFDNPDEAGDVLVVAHGHILRAFAMRWTGKPLTETSLILEAGGVGTLR
jgi:probable phosphoglycerate mutase